MRVKDYKGVAYFKSYGDAKGHMEKYAKIGRLVSLKIRVKKNTMKSKYECSSIAISLLNQGRLFWDS